MDLAPIEIHSSTLPQLYPHALRLRPHLSIGLGLGLRLPSLPPTCLPRLPMHLSRGVGSRERHVAPARVPLGGPTRRGPTWLERGLGVGLGLGLGLGLGVRVRVRVIVRVRVVRVRVVTRALNLNLTKRGRTRNYGRARFGARQRTDTREDE